MQLKDSKGSNSINIRAHHLLCIQGFQGKGYSLEFIENLKEINDFLEENPSTGIKVISEVDEICHYCPHRKGDICIQGPNAEENIKLMDFKTLKYLELKEGKIYNYDYIMELINDKLNLNDLKEICGLCLWINDCKLHNKS